jgi:sugar phosphate isomerase/epimerase
MERRTFLKNTSVASLAMAMPLIPDFSTVLKDTRFGAAEASFMLRRYRKMGSIKYPEFKDQLEMIEHFSSLGFGGAQLTMSGLDKKLAKQILKRREELNFFMEGQIKLPKNKTDVARFEQEVAQTKAMDVEIIRTVCLSGRRYENFETMDAFQAFREVSEKSLQLAEPIMRKHQMKLAVENHKDWRIDDFLQILKKLDSEWIGVTLDTGNNISLLEDPMEVVKALAPYAFTVHLKDMAVEEYEDGFLMAEVNLGDGFLDIEGMISEIRKHNPDIRFNLEMITRDPLKIPCLTEKYWATFDKISASELATFLRKIKEHKSKKGLPIISDKSVDQQLALEIENNQISVVYAKEHFGFS